MGEWRRATRRMKAFDRWGEKLGTPRVRLTDKTDPRRDPPPLRFGAALSPVSCHALRWAAT
jgi:hypothetical protein